jgi:MoaA/NifB/PqqE/SkfB family radical SAM enzyme
MEGALFRKIVDEHQQLGGTDVNILGGEPSVWKGIDQAIIYCREKGINTTVLTNGIEPLRVFPSKVVINVKNIFYNDKKERVLKTIEFYSQNKTNLCFRYNVETEDKRSMFSQVGRLAKRHNASVVFAPVKGYAIERQIGKKLFDFANEILFYKDSVVLDNPVALCVFSVFERSFLKRNCGLYGTCNPGVNILFHPDGETIQPCSALHITKNINNIGKKMNQGLLIFKEEVQNKKLEVAKKNGCLECDFFISKECQGGCVAI